ncbi:MAG TPA: hypothetical protein VEY30_08610 [Myxococcaceae bacterium]|nr:hypothetical protein [Myxococcaceae bacterium]
MRDFKKCVHPEWPRLLEGVLVRARALGSRAVLAFDLDSTVFDNLPRQARILREYGQAHGVGALAACTPACFTDGWDRRAAMRACGVDEETVERHAAALQEFWAERFFSSAYCSEDVPVNGAAVFLERVVRTGANLCYVTGRSEAMREGTVAAMRQHAFPLPNEGRVALMMKPSPQIHDDDYKRGAHAALKALGTLIAAFDNEPTHVNDYFRSFPHAAVIHLATDHSGRPVELLQGIVSVPHFALPPRVEDED